MQEVLPQRCCACCEGVADAGTARARGQDVEEAAHAIRAEALAGPPAAIEGVWKAPGAGIMKFKMMKRAGRRAREAATALSAESHERLTFFPVPREG